MDAVAAAAVITAATEPAVDAILVSATHAAVDAAELRVVQLPVGDTIPQHSCCSDAQSVTRTCITVSARPELA